MTASPKHGRALMEEVENTHVDRPALWWLGESGFILKFQDIVFYVNPPPVPEQGANADLILCTDKSYCESEGGVLPAMLQASSRAKVILPKSAAEQVHASGVPYSRMTTTDADLRVEYFKGAQYGRVYSIPSAHPEFDWTPLGGYPYLGYLIRFGACTIYHSGNCRPYEGLVDRLRPYNVHAALLPINGDGNFEIAEAAQLAEDIGARWLVPMQHETLPHPGVSRFVDHMLGFRPSVGFKVLQVGERWVIPE